VLMFILIDHTNYDINVFLTKQSLIDTYALLFHENL